MERSLKKIREQNEPADLSEILTEARQEGNTSGHNGSVPSQTDGHDNRSVFSKTTEEVPDRAELVRRFNEGIGGKKVPLSSVSNTFQQNTPEQSKENSSAIETQPVNENRASVYDSNTSNVSSLEENRLTIYNSAAIQPGQSEPTSIASSKEVLLSVRDLYKGYVKASKLIPVLNGVSIDVHFGEFLAVVGQSGSGKSTLLHLMGTLDRPDSGTICFDGQRTDNLPLRKRDFLRNRYIGMIFQFYHLIPEMTTLENVIAPLMIRESVFGYFKNRHRFHQKAKDLLETVGLSHRLRHKPNELSGGEMQRASIARALITEPRILLADEPTGNLDSKTSVGIMKLLRDLNLEKKLTIVMVTHDMEQANDCDRAIRLVDGQVVGSLIHQ